MNSNPFLVSPDWLAERLGDPELSIVDASWYLPAMKRDGRAEFDEQHIPGAVFFDLDAFSDPASPLPHTLASAEQFAEMAGALGISERDTIVCYDGMGLFSAARAWWNFRVMGAAKVVILDGGFPAWLEARAPVEAGLPPVKAATFTARPDLASVVPLEEMMAVIAEGRMQVADARPRGRFTGEEPEPREGMRSGHMPGATSLPFLALTENGRLLPVPDLKARFLAAGLDPTAPAVTTCGSGVTAAVISLALESVGNRNHRLYDGSWSEWGSREDTPVEQG